MNPNSLKNEFKVRSYLPGDEQEIVGLLELAFNGWPNFDLNCSPLDHWKWKHLDNPLKMTSIVVALSDNQIIGCGHGYNVKIKIGGKSSLCAYGCDQAVHPDYRQMGIMKKLRGKKEELRIKNNAVMAYRITRNPIVFESWIRMGRPRFPQAVVNLVRVHDIDEQLKMMPIPNAFFKRLGFQIVKLFNDFRNAVSRSESTEDPSIVRVDGFDERVDDFWEKISGHYDFIVERRHDYLNWRYCDPRAGDFVVKQAEEDGRILGYSVLKINKIREAYPVGFIVDMLALPDRLEIVDALTSDAVNYFDSSGVNIVSCLQYKNHPYNRVFNRYGFLDSRTKIHVSYTNYGSEDELKKLRTSSRIHFTYGDIDSLPSGMIHDF